jgi:hypothetical protein
MKALFAEEDGNKPLRDLYPHVMEVFGRDGWDDPAMDVYDELDPRRTKSVRAGINAFPPRSNELDRGR